MCNGKNKDKDKDEELLKFLKFSYFGNLTISIEVASNRAYRDMCRTLKFDVLPKNTKTTITTELKEAVNIIFKEEIPIINEGNITSPEEFNSWHEKVCYLIIKKYEEHGIKLTYGQAQKWLNMTIKYLYMLQVYSFDRVINCLHIPVDKYILEVVEKELGIKRPVDAWSRWDNYKEYEDYQKAIREELKKRKYSPLIWEFENWLKEVQEDKKR